MASTNGRTDGWMDGWAVKSGARETVARCKSDNPGATIGREVKRVCSSLENDVRAPTMGPRLRDRFSSFFRWKKKEERKRGEYMYICKKEEGDDFRGGKKGRGMDGTGQVHARIGHNEANQAASVHTIDNKPYIIFVEKRSQNR